MAVDLPPPVPPEQGTVQQAEAVATVTFQEYSIQIMGPKVVDQALLAQAVARADTLSNAVRSIQAVYYAAGYPAARLTYSLNDKTLLATVTLGGISGISGVDTPAKQYLAPLVGKTPLAAKALEPKRILASVHANRAGQALVSEWVPGSDGNSELKLKEGPEDLDPTQVRVELGNPGNRFVGRYFIDIDLRTGNHYGDEFRAIARAGQHGFSNNDSDYFEQNLGWSRVTPWGIFGAGGRYVDLQYTTELPNKTPPPSTKTGPANGQIWFGEVSWLYPLVADFHHRLLIGAKVDRNSRWGDDAATGEVYLREVYTSVEASAAYQRNLSMLGTAWDLDAGLAIRKGLTSDETPSAANQDYLLYRPSVRLKDHLTDRYAVSVELSGQFTSDPLPEQQQWVLGGQGNITTAVPGVAVGDQGYLVRLVGEAGTFKVLNIDLTPKVFIESGEASLELFDASPALTDVGFEVNAQVFDWLGGSLAYAQSISDKDLSDADKDESDANLFFRIEAKF